MDDATTARLQQVKDDLLSAINEVDGALESGEERRQLDAGQQVRDLTQKYQALILEIPPTERDAIERTVGRRITDLRRQAASLTQKVSGSRAVKVHEAGSLPFLEQRAPPKSIVPSRAAPSLGHKRSVSDELDSWCGKCKEMREHRIVALVGDEPKQVICVVCGSRHGYRSEPPARARNVEVPAPTPEFQQMQPSSGKRLADEREAQKRQELKRALQKELADAPNPRPFDPKGRYKAGEIIVHAEHGRGKIENVLKSSLLVRFLEGLRPLDLS